MSQHGHARSKLLIVLVTAGLLAAVYGLRGSLPLLAVGDDPAVETSVVPIATLRSGPGSPGAPPRLPPGGGVWDSHPDADVGRVMQPGLVDRVEVNDTVGSNAWGQREREWSLPKAPGTVRVVLLGDSFIYGMGVPAEERLGVGLERALRERCGAAGGSPPGAPAGTTGGAPAIEVLHVGATSWNIVAECSWVRRQLALLQPDLVIHHIVGNDVDDTAGVRGSGVLGRLVPRHPGHGDAVLSLTYSTFSLDPGAKGLLSWGMDWESRQRLTESGEQIERLARAVTASGGRYLLLVNWHAYLPVAELHITRRLPPEQVAWLPSSAYHDARYRISPKDEHWNRDGHERMARVLYGLIATRGLLPSLGLQPWPEAAAEARALDDEGRAEATQPGQLEKKQARQKVATSIDFGALDAGTAGQVHGGVDREGLLAPYAALILARGTDGARLHVTGECLPRPELDGARVAVWIDDETVASITLRAGAGIDVTAELPAAARQRAWLSARFIADDYAYTGADLRQCASLRLKTVAIEP